MDPGNWPRIWRLGGLGYATPAAAPRPLDDWKLLPAGEQSVRAPAPRWAPTSPAPFAQPAASGDVGPADELSVHVAGLGKVTFDPRSAPDSASSTTASEGIAHYGLYADWLQDLRCTRRAG